MARPRRRARRRHGLYAIGRLHDQFNAPRLVNVFSVAIAPNGDCWAAGWNGHESSLAYFAQCRHTGVIASGFTPSQFSWLDIDGKGNLVTIGEHPQSLPGFFVCIYSGCDPECSLVGGPLQSRAARVTLTRKPNVWSSPIMRSSGLTSTHTARTVLSTNTVSATVWQADSSARHSVRVLKNSSENRNRRRPHRARR